MKESDPAPTARAARACQVTAPGVEVKGTGGGFNHGSEALAVALWPKGTLLAGRLPDGGYYAEVSLDGSIEAKLGWWRGEEGALRVEGERLDASAPPLLASIPAGYGPTGFQPTGLTCPTEGCWEVRGSVGRTRLSFVVLVRKL
jgi:hypothetical protein